MLTGDQFRISFRGQLPQGGAAMPLAAQALAALQDVSVPEDVVTVSPVQVDLMTLLDNQRAIYQRVQEIAPLQADQVELFRLLAEQEMADAYNTQIHEGATGAAFLSEGEATVQKLHDQFIARVTNDVATAQAAADEILAKSNEQIKRFAGPGRWRNWRRKRPCRALRFLNASATRSSPRTSSLTRSSAACRPN